MRLVRNAYFILLLLKELPHGLRKKDIVQFLGISQNETDCELGNMLNEGVIEYNNTNGHWRMLKSHSIPEWFRNKGNLESANLAEQCLLLISETTRFDACIKLQEYLQQLITNSALIGTSVCLDLIISQLLMCPFEKLDDSSLRKYLELILSVQSDAFSLGVSLKMAHSLSPIAVSAAKMLGDQRTLALINIMDGCLWQHSCDGKARDLNKFFGESFAAISSLGDDDIENQIKHFLSFLYYSKGDYKSCYEAFDAAQSHLQIMSCRYFNTLYPIYLAPAACRIGQYAQSVGICTGALHEAKHKKDKYKELWLTVILAVQFLQIRDNEHGISLLADVLDCIDAEATPKLYLWAWRALALYHANLGNIKFSHRIMTVCMEKRFRQGIGRFAYTSVWILEMLESYERHGLPPVPGYNLDSEIERVLTGHDRHLHGMAFRIKAQRQPQGNLDDKIKLLRCSYEIFKECGNKKEAARSALMLAHYYVKVGRKEAAHDLRKVARMDLLATMLRPVGNLPQIAPWKGNVYSSMAQPCLQKCFSAINEICLKHSAEAYSGQLLNILQRELGAERAAFFKLTFDGEINFIAGSNLSEDYSSWHIVESIRPLNRKDGSRWILVPSPDNICLCLRIPTEGEDALFLFLESSYVAGAFVNMTEDNIKCLLAVLERELANLCRMQSSQQNERKVPALEFVIPDSDMIEYDNSPNYMRILEKAKNAAWSDAPILILGETGVGKEVLARQIHRFSGRTGMFVPVHPASIPESLFESELFGYEKGAFTGAHKQKIGFFELADNGTFFIDELAEIPMSFQVKLLRVLEEHSFNRVGGIRYIKSNFRLVTATNKNLWNEVQEGHFREDLYYRVSVIPIKLPPLRERQQDIPRLINMFLHQFCTRYGRKVPHLTDELIEQCRNYSWPGNIREMRNIVERAVILYTDGPLKLFLPEYGYNEETSFPSSKKDCSKLYADLPTMEELNIRYMRYILEKTQGKVIGPGGAEKILGMKRSTLYSKLRRYGLK